MFYFFPFTFAMWYVERAAGIQVFFPAPKQLASNTANVRQVALGLAFAIC